jgi:hypothetical protein
MITENTENATKDANHFLPLSATRLSSPANLLNQRIRLLYSAG